MRNWLGVLVVTGVAMVLLSACGMVDACTLLTPQQQKQLAVDRAPSFSKDTDPYWKPAL